MCSSILLSLLFIPLVLFFFFSVIEFYISDWVFFIFSTSLLKCSVCISIIFTKLFNLFINNALNHLSGKLLLIQPFFFFSELFSCSFN